MNKQDNVPQVKTVEEQSDNLKLIVKLEQIRNSTYNLFGKKPLAFEKSFLKNLNANGVFLFYTDKPFKDLQSRIAELEAERDKYREALERLLKLNTDIDNFDMGAIEQAEQALNSKEVGK